MPLPRTRLPLAGALVVLALSACGAARPTATVVATAPVAADATATTSPAATASGPGATTVSPTTGPGPTVAPAAPGATDPTPTTGAGSAAPNAPDAPDAPATPTSGPAGPATGPVDESRVALVFERLGYPLTAEERRCIAGVVAPETLAALEGGGDNALVGTVTSNFVMALATCEPLTFVLEQDDITMQDYGVDAAAARCVTLALNKAARADPAVAFAYYEGTNFLPPAGQQALIDALTPCVGAEKAREIITTT